MTEQSGSEPAPLEPADVQPADPRTSNAHRVGDSKKTITHPTRSGRPPRPDDFAESTPYWLIGAIVAVLVWWFWYYLWTIDFGIAMVVAIPFGLGFILGFGFRGVGIPAACLFWLATPMMALTLVGLAMTWEAIGLLCGVFAIGPIWVPTLIGVVLGRLLQRLLRTTLFRHKIIFGLCMACMPPAVDWCERALAFEIAPEEFAAELVLPASPDVIWRTSLTTFDTTPPRFLDHIGLPALRQASGTATAVGDIKRIDYDKGHVIFEVTASEPPSRLALRVIEQVGLERRAAHFLDASITLRSGTAANTSIVGFAVRYQPQMRPRWLWRTSERIIGAEACRRMLEATATAALRRGHQ